MINSIKNILGFGPQPDFAKLKEEGAIILDVRNRNEYAGGNIKGSINIPVEVLKDNLNRLKDKDKPIITCCATGMRSSSAKKFLKDNGYKEVHNGGSWMRLNKKL